MRKKALLIIAVLMFGELCYAQELTKSEKKEQASMEAENDKVFADDDPGFAVTAAPDKWKNESAVILNQNIQFEYYTESHMVKCDEYVRKRILLLDKSAIDANSTFTFLPGQEVGFRVVKKDGTVKKISTADAVDVKEGGGYSLFGRSAYYGSNFYSGYKKLAVPGLEQGDIIDYYYKYTEGYPTEFYRFVPFSSIAFTLPEQYPILKQSVIFYVEKGYYINFSSANGAPDLTITDVGDKKTKELLLTDANRDKEVDEIWKYPYRSEPTIKFQVVYAASQSVKDDVPYFLGQAFVPTTKVPHALLQGVADQIAMEKNETSTKLANETISYMKQMHKGLISDPMQYMQYAYYYMRFFLTVEKRREYENASTNNYYDNRDVTYAQFIPKDPSNRISDELFIKAMGLIARDKNIPYELIFGVPRHIGTLDNMVLRSDMQWLIKIKGGNGKEVLMYPFSTFSNPNDPMESMEGVDAYTIIPSKSSEDVVMNKTSIPVSGYSSNVYSYKLEVNLNPAIDGPISVVRNATITGLAKESFYPEILIDDVYNNQEMKKYDQKTDMDNIGHISNAKEKATETQRFKDALDEDLRKRLSAMEDKAKENYDIDSYDEFNLVNGGIEMDSTSLMFNDKFKIKSLAKKVGPNYILEVGKLIGSQVELKDKDSARTNDIYMAFARETDNELDIAIPAGYSVDGVNALNVNVSGQTGGFVSTAKVDGGKLIINTKKYYTSNYEPKSSWADMYKFLRACYDFSQKKVLLKKA